MYNRIIKHCIKLIPPHQHGFTRQRGTATQILRTGKYITDALNDGHSVSMISTDLSKAFDSLNHRGLVRKLQLADIPNNIVKLIENYLDGRRIRGKIRTTTGTEKPVPHGVPQGSILGPLIFNLYVSDINTSRISGLLMSQYADDLCVLNTSKQPNIATNKTSWVAREILAYYKRWGLKCNVEKTDCIMFTSRRQNYEKKIAVGDRLLEYKNSVKYLGVILDKTMRLKPHVEAVIKKARRTRAALAPIIGYRSRASLDTKMAVIQSCLLPILDYGTVQLWPCIAPYLRNKIEPQYKMALKAAAGLPRRLDSDILWELMDVDKWTERATYLHHDMVDRMNELQVPDLEVPGPAYARYGRYNPLLYDQRVGDINYISKALRRLPVSKRPENGTIRT